VSVWSRKIDASYIARLHTCYKPIRRSFLTDLKPFLLLSVLILFSMLFMSLLFVRLYFVDAQLTTNNSTIPQKIGVKIISPKANQTVPLGQLTIYGTSSDTPETNCQVYADWNDTKPMQNATANGPGGLNDYSNWTFTYTQKYHLISEGTNELTSKISCYNNSDNVTTKFYSINITGSTKPTNSGIPGTYNSHASATFHSADDHSILPRYSDTVNHDSKNVSEVGNPKSNIYIEISSGYSDDKNNNGDNKIIKFKTASSLISSKVEKTMDGQNNLNIKWYNGEPIHQDLNKYIHNLIKEKLDKISDKLTD
jgi:hypothetical protein